MVCGNVLSADVTGVVSTWHLNSENTNYGIWLNTKGTIIVVMSVSVVMKVRCASVLNLPSVIEPMTKRGPIILIELKPDEHLANHPKVRRITQSVILLNAKRV